MSPGTWTQEGRPGHVAAFNTFLLTQGWSGLKKKHNILGKNKTQLKDALYCQGMYRTFILKSTFSR